MEDFAKYNTKLEQIFHFWTHESDQKFKNKSAITAQKVRELIDITTLRESGVFFTSDYLAEKAIDNFNNPITGESFIVDPTCGSGSLLVAASKKMPIADSASATLEQWGKQLCGFDIYSEFVECTKLRIVLETLVRGAKPDKSLKELTKLLSNIQTGNCLENKEIISKATHLALNPPYNNSRSAVKYSWGSGKINNAAIFYFELSLSLKNGCSISAILPDVLRSGSRFESWRIIVEERLADTRISTEGRFDKNTDIDIFLINGVIKRSNHQNIQWQPKNDYDHETHSTIGHYFKISVGAVVPFRDPHEGPNYSYIHPKTLPKWGEVKKIPEKRKFLGRVFQPPFVVIRRTSGPRDRHRAVPTLILGKRLVAVENHLLVLTPKDGDLRYCRELLELLKKEQVNLYLNNRIRCRHLTVSAISEIPWSIQ
ncbi:N-6 DNA methylase [Pseudomonas sp. AAC]|uniref:N-6 DNA methylase n=1 Tax=Pseudomonas sp. AAC TaxID=1502784 RepID=UPI0012DF17CE|nr:N-6 DNA methylase [Pseudomonas sp. AAC]